MFPADSTITDEATFRNADNAPYDPTSVVLEVRQPDASLVYPTVTKISTGIYRAVITLRRGFTRWEWDGITGAVHDKLVGSTCSPEGLTG